MAKIVAAAATEEKAPAKGGKLKWIIMGVVCLLACGAGFAMPLALKLGPTAQAAPEGEEPKPTKDPKEALLAFDPVTVNVATGTYTRYLRVKFMLVVDEAQETKIKELIEKKKPFLQDWLNGFLADRTLEELHGSAGKNRVRREVRDEFNRILFPDGTEKIKNVLFTEFQFQ